LLLFCCPFAAVRELPRGRVARARARWSADVIAVVGWFGEDISWLRRLPLGDGPGGVRLALYIKHAGCTCADVPADVAPHVALCERTFNSDGRDTHTALSFIVSHYALLPRVLFFLHGDAPDHAGPASWMDGRFRPEYIEALEREPAGTPPACGCDVVTESFYRPCTSPFLLAPDAPGCYRYHEPMTFLLDTLFGVAPENGTRVTWVTAGQLAVSSSRVRAHPLVAYRVALALMNSTTFDPFWRMPNDAALHFQSRGGGTAGKTWSSLELGHAFERIWLTVWNARGEGRAGGSWRPSTLP
jgi:hypothetical protein